jgi:hypothetical protein
VRVVEGAGEPGCLTQLCPRAAQLPLVAR